MTIVVNPKVQRFTSKIIGKYINSPEQRLIQGVTALALQPAIDYMNHKADDETRAVSVARTIGKIIAGTIVGVAVRYGAIALAKNFTHYKVVSFENNFIKAIAPKTKKDFLMPSITFDNPNKIAPHLADLHDNYIKTIGTLIATFAMVFTNFLIDAPLTKWITKKLTPNVRNRINEKEKPEVKESNG